MKPDAATVTRYADALMTEIHDDMREPFPWGKHLPRNVGSFSALHDYLDANCYLLDLVPRPAPECDCDMSARVPSLYDPSKLLEDHTEGCATNSAEYEAAQEANAALDNAVSDEVDRRLVAEAEKIHSDLADGSWQLDYGVIDGERVEAWFAEREPGSLTDDDLGMIYEALEITSQSLDRPEPGTAEKLAVLMVRVSRMRSKGGSS